MSRRTSILRVLGLLAVLWTMAGCRPQQPFYFHERHEDAHYLDVATEIEFPDVKTASLDEVRNAVAPLTLENPTPESIWEMPLEEVMRVTLENSKVIRSLSGVVFGASGAQGEPSALTAQPNAASTVYNPAITETDARFGVEGALAAFDAQFSTSLLWGKNDEPVNVGTFGETFFATTKQEDTGTFQAQIQKTYPTGGVFSIQHNVRYLQSNSPIRLFPSDWYTDLTAEFRQPLLQGAGVQFNRIAGPNAIPGFNQGVLLARVRSDMALTEFEGSVRNLVRDVERNYWELYFAYRRLSAVVAGRNSALQTWRQTYARYVIGATRGSAQDEAQARQQYFLFRSSTEEALSSLYRTENALRYLMGLAANDGRLIRPSDEPTTAKVTFDWYQSECEALARSVELRQQKWTIKQRELELIAARNYMLPRLDASGLYRWNGLGDNLVAYDGSSNGYGSLTEGKFADWQLGLNLNIPLGFRKEASGVRNAELALARDRAILQDQELELSHQLTSAMRDLSDRYVVAQTNFNRREAGAREVEAVKARYNAGETTLDQLLNAQRRLAEAENDYYRSVIDYNLAISNVHYRKGSLLEYNSVHLAEGPWPAKAYFDACRKARARDGAAYVNYGYTMPRVLSRGPISQEAGTVQPPPAAAPKAAGGSAGGGEEQIPAPKPESIQAPSGENPLDQLPAPAKETSRPQTGTKHAASAVRPGGNATEGASWTPKAAKKGNFDLGSLDLDPLAGHPSREPPQADVRPVSYLEPAGTGGKAPQAAASQWKNPRRSATAHESVTTETNAEADRTASGWKRVQH